MPIILTGGSDFGQGLQNAGQNFAQAKQDAERMRLAEEEAGRRERLFQEELHMADLQADVATEQARKLGLENDLLEQSKNYLASLGEEGQAVGEFLSATDETGERMTALARFAKAAPAFVRRMFEPILEDAQLQMEAEQAQDLAARMDAAPWLQAAEGQAVEGQATPGQKFLEDLGNQGTTLVEAEREFMRGRDQYAQAKKAAQDNEARITRLREDIAAHEGDASEAAMILAQLEAEMEVDPSRMSPQLYGRARAKLLDSDTRQAVIQEEMEAEVQAQQDKAFEEKRLKSWYTKVPQFEHLPGGKAEVPAEAPKQEIPEQHPSPNPTGVMGLVDDGSSFGEALKPHLREGMTWEDFAKPQQTGGVSGQDAEFFKELTGKDAPAPETADQKKDALFGFMGYMERWMGLSEFPQHLRDLGFKPGSEQKVMAEYLKWKHGR